ncbi:MAG: RNB domain-containing ribonuclease, partial [Candidatus Taylorbacteria bacterium]
MQKKQHTRSSSHSDKKHTPHTNTSTPKKTSITGVISTTQKGAGYIDNADPKKDSIYIEQGTLNTALNGDTVEVSVSKKAIRGVTQEVGVVTKIISRAKETFVGTVEVGKEYYTIVPDDRKMYVSIVISIKEGDKLHTDEKVLVRMLPWTDATKNPTGKLIRVLGKKGVNDVEMESIVLEKGFEVGFPHAVEQEAEEIEKNKVISADEISKRRDMRTTETFTIDPFDAKDFDDAISFKVLPDDLYEIGVHIADVSHYVRLG